MTLFSEKGSWQWLSEARLSGDIFINFEVVVVELDMDGNGRREGDWVWKLR